MLRFLSKFSPYPLRLWIYKRVKAQYISSLAKRNGTLLEIGAWQGTTTKALARAGKTTTVEISPTKDLRNLCDKKGIELLVGSSMEVLDKLPDKSFDFIYVDASKEYDDVKQDIISSKRLIAKGGVIVLDDYDDSHPGVVRAVDEELRGGYKDKYSLFIFKQEDEV